MSSKGIRIFFALWPDDKTRQQIVLRSRNIHLEGHGIRPVSPSNLHMTLDFIGSTSMENMQCLDEQASRVSSPAFQISLSRLGYFKKNRILWLGCGSRSEGLDQLHHRLQDRLSNCGFEAEQQEYRPHVTLFKKATILENLPSIDPFVWSVNSFSMIQSVSGEQGVIYSELKTYSLHPM